MRTSSTCRAFTKVRTPVPDERLLRLSITSDIQTTGGWAQLVVRLSEARPGSVGWPEPQQEQTRSQPGLLWSCVGPEQAFVQADKPPPPTERGGEQHERL